MAKNHNMTRYMKNAAKSVGKVASEVVKTTMPVMSDTAINSQQTIQEFRRVVTTGRSSINRANIIQNKLFKPVQQILANAKEDLKSGNLYNTSRNSNDYGMSDLMDSLLDDEPMEDIESPVMDMSAFNKVLQSSTASSLAGYDKSTKMLAKNSTANTEYLGELQTKLNTQHMMILTQHHMQLMKKMDNLQNIGMSLMEFNTKTATDYFDKDIQMQSAQLSELQEIRKILDEQHEIMHKTMRNSNANKGPKASNLANIFNPNGSFNTSGFIQNAKNNISNKIPVSKDMFGFVFNEFKDNPVGTLLTMAIKGGIPGKTKKKFSSMDNAFSGALANLMLTLNAWNNGPTDKEWKRTLGSIFGTNKQSFNTNLGLYKNQELNADLELKKSKAITEVIPSYLSEILKSMTGIDKSFDYGKGRFVDNAKIRSDLVRDRRAAAASTASRSSDYVKKKATGFANNLNKRERDSFVDDIEAFHEWYMITDLYKKKSVTYEEALKNGLPDLDGGGSTFRLIWQMYKSCDQSKINRDRIDYQLGMLDQIHYQTMDTIMSGRSAAINGLSDERDINILHMNKRPGAKVNRGSYNIDKYNKTQFNKVINSIDDDAFTIDFDINNYKEPGKIEKLVKKWRGDINQFVNSRFGGSKHFSKARTYANRLMNQALKQAEKANDPRFYEDIVANVQNAVANKFGGSTNVKENIRTRTANTKENVKTTASNARTTVTNAVGTVQAQVQNAASNILGDDKVSAGSVDEPPSNTGRGKLYEYAKGMLPSTVVSGAIGGVIGKLFNRSPLLGSIIGAGANILYQSSKVQEMLYGDPNKEDDNGLIGDIKNKFDKAIFEPLQKVMDPFNQLLTEKIINPMHNWLNKKADGINAWLSNKLGVETAKKSKEQVRHEETIKVLTEIKEATQGKTDEAKKVTEVITEAINPEAAKSKGKVTKVFDKALSGIKDGAVTGVSAGKGALISSLLGLGPIPGMIFGTLMGRHKVKKNHKNDTDVNTQKEADDVDEAVKTATGDKKKAGFGTRLKYETIGSAASSLLGLGPIPGFLVGRIYANHKKPKEKKKLTQEQKEAAKLQKQLDWQANGGMKGAAKRFFGKRKNEILGMAGSSLLGLGPIPGLIAARVYNKSKYKLKKGENPDDESTNANNIKSTTDSIKEKINKQKAARTEQALGKELIKNAMNGDLEATQEKIKNLQTNADSEEELAMIKRQSDVASNISGLSGGVGGSGTSEKKSGLFDLLKNLAGGLGSIISKLGIGGILKLLAGGLGIGVLQKGINYINDLKDHGAGGLGTENDYGDSNFANWTDNAINGMKFGQGAVANIFGRKFISGLTKRGKLSTVTGGALNSALKSGVGAFYAGQSMKYNFGQAGAYSDRYDTNSANSERILGIHRGTQMFTNGINALGSLSAAVAPKLGDAVLNAGVGLEKVAANTKDGGVINKVASKAAELCGKVLGVKSLTTILEKAGIKNIGKSAMQRLIQTVLVKLPGNATSKLADLVPVFGQIWLIAKYVAAFIRGINNTRKDLKVAEDFEYNSFGFVALKVINGLFYCLDEFLCGILTSFNMQSIFLELCLKLPCFSNLGDKVKESQEKAQSDYETFLQENDLNREGYTYEMYQKQINPTTWGKIKKLFTGKKGYEDYKSGGKKNAQLKAKYGGYVSADSVETDATKAVNAMQEVYAEQNGNTGTSYSGDNNSITTYDSSTTNNIILNGVTTTGSGGRGVDTGNIRTVVGSAIKSLSKTSHNNNWNTYDLKHGKGVMDNFKGNSPLRKVRPANVDAIYKKIGLISGSGRRSGRGASEIDVVEGAPLYDMSAGRGSVIISYHKPSSFGRGVYSPSTKNNFPYFLQGDERWRYTPFTITGSSSQNIGSSGCGPTSMAIVMSSYGIAIDPPTAATYALDNGFRTANSGTSWGYFASIGSKYGLTVKQTGSFSEALEGLKNGIPVVASMSRGTFTSGGHYIVLCGVTSDGNIVVNDCASEARTGKTYPASTFVSEGAQFWLVSKNGKGSIGNVSTTNSNSKIKISNVSNASSVSTSFSGIPALMRTRLYSSRNDFSSTTAEGAVTNINNDGFVSYSDSSGSRSSYKSIGEAVKSGGSNIINGIKTAASKGWNALKTGATKVATGIKTAASKGWNALKTGAAPIKDKITGSGARGNSRGEDVDYYNQADPRWGNNSFGRYDGHRDTIADGGCGPTVAAMAMQKLTGKTITPDNMAKLAMSSGMKYDDGGTDPGFFNQVGSKYGYSFNQSNGIDENTISTLKSGKPVIFMGQDQTGTSPFGSGMHYVLGTGIDSNGNINILDPQNQYNNRAYNINDIAASTVNTISPRGKSKPIRHSSRGSRSNNQNIRRSFMNRNIKSPFGRGSKVKNTLFVGDSWMARSSEFKYRFDDSTNSFITVSGAKATDFIGQTAGKKNVEKIFFMMGLNHPERPSAANITPLLDELRKNYPSAQIYVSAVPHVPACKADGINGLNNNLKSYVNNKSKMTFVDSVSCLYDSTDTVKSEYLETDNVHMNFTGVSAWCTEIEKILTTGSSSSSSGTSKSSGISYIVIHYTANTSDASGAKANCNYFKTDGREASAHYFVDRTEIRQSVPDNKRAWHCGTEDGNYYCSCRNDNSIGIELCSYESNGTYYIHEDTQKNGANLTKYLMKKYGVSINNVIRHYDVTHKICPEPFVRDESQWTKFKSMVNSASGTVNIIQDLTTCNFSDRTGTVTSDPSNGNGNEASIGGGNYISSLMNTLSGIWSSAYTSGLFNNISAMFNGGETSSLSSGSKISSSGGKISSDDLGKTLTTDQAHNRDPRSYSKITAEQLKKAITDKNSKSYLANHVDDIIRASEKTGLDPRFITAFAIQESGWTGSKISRDKNNYFGIGAVDSDPYNKAYTFSSPEEGFTEGAQWILDNYITQGQNTLWKFDNAENGWHNYNSGGTNGMLPYAELYKYFINATGGAGARGGRGSSFNKGRGIGVMTPHISPRMKNNSSIMNRSDINLVKSAMETKSRGNSISSVQHVHTNTGRASDTSSVDTTTIVKALGMIIDLLSNIDKSNTAISNKEFSSNTVVAAPLTNVQSSIPQGTNTSKQNLLSAIVSGI